MGARAKGTAYSKKVSLSPLTRKPDGTLGQFFMVHGGETRLGAKFSFAKLNDNYSYQGYPYAVAPLRTAEMWDAFYEKQRAGLPSI